MPNNKAQKKSAKNAAGQAKKAPPPPRSTPKSKKRAAKKAARQHVNSASKSALNLIAQTMALPAEHNPIRLPVGDPERTSVLSFTNQRDFAVPASGSRYAMMLRSPTRPLWLSRDPPTAAGSIVQIYTIAGVQPALPNGVGEAYSLTDFFSINRIANTVITGATPLTDYTPALDKNNCPWFYCPAGGLVPGARFTVSTTPAPAGAWALEVEYTTSWSTSDVTTVSIQLGSTFTYVEGYATQGQFVGWWRPTQLICTNPTATDCLIQSLTIGVTTGNNFSTPSLGTLTPYWDLPPMMEEQSVPIPWNDTRVTAVSTLFMNTTSVLNKEGRVQQVRANSRRAAPFSPSFFTSGFQQIFDSASKDFRYAGLLEHGAYCFAKPDDSSTQFRDWSTGNLRPFYLDAFDYVDLIKFTDHSSGSETNLTAVTDFHIEFRCTLNLWTTAVSRLPYELYRQSAASLSAMHNTYENPVHFKDVVSGIRKMLRWSAPIVAPYARGALTALARSAIGIA